MNFQNLPIDANRFPAGSGGYADMGNLDALQELSKALVAGDGVDAGSFTGGRALIPESLENTLVNVLWTQDEARLFQRIKKKPIPSPVHQWDKRTGVGNADGAWVPETGESQEANQTIARVYETSKYLQTLRKASLQATLSNMIEDALTVEQNAGALWVIQQVEKALFYGNDLVFPEQPKGIKQQATTNVLDARGATASGSVVEKLINEGARGIRDFYGKGSLLLSSTMIHSDLQNLIRDRVRFQAGQDMGTAIFNQYPTPFGQLELLDDVFIKERGIAVPSSIVNLRPAQVTINSVAQSAGTSKFSESDLGTYYYKVAAVNRYGEGLASAEASIAVNAAGNTVDFNVSVTPDPSITAYAVYRSKKGAANGNDARFMGYFTAYEDGVNDTFSESNEDLPGTSDIFILTMGEIYDAIEWFQFLPLMKFDLYPTNAAVYPFLMLLFGAMALKKEEQHAYIKNVSPADLGWY